MSHRSRTFAVAATLSTSVLVLGIATPATSAAKHSKAAFDRIGTIAGAGTELVVTGHTSSCSAQYATINVIVSQGGQYGSGQWGIHPCSGGTHAAFSVTVVATAGFTFKPGPAIAHGTEYLTGGKGATGKPVDFTTNIKLVN
jgi:hypothetical protein